MTDIGFGLIDRRTVIVVLFSMVLAHVLGNLQLPIDTSDAGRLFIDLVLLSGYLYMARSIYRLPIALSLSLMNLPGLGAKIADWPRAQLERLDLDTGKTRFEKPRKFVLWIVLYVCVPLATLLGLPFLVFSFGKWGETISKEYKYASGGVRLLIVLFGTLDRVGLVIIALLATVPSLRPIVTGVGIIGLISMVAVFTIRGDFTALIRDILEKKEHEEKEKEEATPFVEVKNSALNPLYVRIVSDNTYDIMR